MPKVTKKNAKKASAAAAVVDDEAAAAITSVASSKAPKKAIVKATRRTRATLPKEDVMAVEKLEDEGVGEADGVASTSAAAAAPTKKRGSKIKFDGPEHPASQDDYATPYGAVAGHVKLMSFNVNGLNAAIKNGLVDYLKREDPSVVCLQETKTQSGDDEKWKKALGSWPHAYFSCSTAKGHHGAAVLSKVAPVSVHYGLHDSNEHEPGWKRTVR
jgi:hypothetical protein